MDAEVFYSEFFRVTHTTRKRLIREQLSELNELSFAPVFTVAETATIHGRQIMQRRLWQVRNSTWEN